MPGSTVVGTVGSRFSPWSKLTHSLILLQNGRLKSRYLRATRWKWDARVPVEWGAVRHSRPENVDGTPSPESRTGGLSASWLDSEDGRRLVGKL